MLPPERPGELVVGDVAGVVLVHVDLLEDDVGLRRDVLGPKGGPEQHLGQQLHAHGKVVVAQLRPEAGVLLGGEGVAARPHRVERLGDGLGTQLRGALEEQVLEEV